MPSFPTITEALRAVVPDETPWRHPDMASRGMLVREFRWRNGWRIVQENFQRFDPARRGKPKDWEKARRAVRLFAGRLTVEVSWRER